MQKLIVYCNSMYFFFASYPFNFKRSGGCKHAAEMKRGFLLRFQHVIWVGSLDAEEGHFKTEMLLIRHYHYTRSIDIYEKIQLRSIHFLVFILL